MLKRLALRTLMQPSVGRLLSRLRRDRCAIVMMHRFAVPESARTGYTQTPVGIDRRWNRTRPSLWTDLFIMARTVPVILLHIGGW